MDTRIVIFGVLLIMGAIANQIVVPDMMSPVNNLTDSIQIIALSDSPDDIQTGLSDTSTSAKMNAGIYQFHVQLTTIENFIQIGSITMVGVGVGFVIIGMARKDKRFHQKALYLHLKFLKKD